MTESQEATVEGEIEQVVYSNEDNSWSVVRVRNDRNRLVTVVGNLVGAEPGESIRAHGRWVQDRRFGEQFRADSYVPLGPAADTVLGQDAEVVDAARRLLRRQ